MRIAVCQIEIVDSDSPGNLARIEAATEQARHHQADIACFPEAALLGWGNPRAAELAPPIPGAHSEALCTLARRCGLMVCAGLHERSGDLLFNTALLIDRDGQVAHRHRKINLIEGVESPPTAAGSPGGLRVVDTRLGRIGLMICADSFIAAHRTALAAQKPDLVLIPYAWAAPAAEWPAHGEKLRAVIADNARDMGCPVVGTDGVGVMTAGPWKDYVVGGASAVYWPGPLPHLDSPCGLAGVWVAEV